MRKLSAICGSVALAAALGISLSTTGVQASQPKASAALVAKGKALVSSLHCDGCHGADLKGKPHFSPSLHPNQHPVSEYTQALFVRLLTTGVDNDGKPVRPPMNNACHQTPGDSKAVFAYLKSLK
jgi:mono/diheme cytochrome c family protein